MEKEKFKSLSYYLEQLEEKEIERLYEIYSMFFEENKKLNQEEKLEIVRDFILMEYDVVLNVNEDEKYDVIKDIIAGKKVKNVDKYLLDEYFVFKTDNGYEVPLELAEAFEQANTSEKKEAKKKLIFSYYLIINGLIEIDKMIELMQEHDYKLTKKEIKELAKENNFEIIEDVIYLNHVAKELNQNNWLLDLKKENEYKISSFSEMVMIMSSIEINNFVNKISNFLKKKIKNEKDLNICSQMIYYFVSVDVDYDDLVNDTLNDFSVKFTKKEEKNFYEFLSDVYFNTPSWSLNGYIPYELLEYDEDSHDDCDCSFCNHNLDSFDFIESKEEKIISCINVYLMINGIIEIENLLKIMEEHYDIKSTKKEVIKIAKEIEDIFIIENYLSLLEFDKETFLYLLTQKRKNDYYIVENFDKVFDEVEDAEEELESLMIEYNINQDLRGVIFTMISTGLFNEEVLFAFLEDNNAKIPLKKQNQFLKELKPIIRNYRLWYLNGFKPLEMNNEIKKEKIGRNDLCTCGSGKKYKQCCGK